MKQGWEIKKLGEITEQINGLWIGKNPPFVTIAVIRNTNFTKDCNLDTNNIAYIQVEQKQYSTRKLKCGDIIIEKSGGSDKQPVGRPILFNIEDGEYSFSNFTSVLRVVDNTLISPKFLHKFLVYIYNQGYTLNMQSKTTGIRNLNFKLYKNMNVPVPERAEQERIVGELDCLSGIIAAKRAQLRELDTLAQSIFYTMFGDPITNDKGWQTNALGNVCIVNPPKKDTLADVQSDDFVSFIPMEDLSVKAGYVKSKQQRLCKDVQSSYTCFADNDILMAKVTPCFENGKVGITQNLVNGIGFGSSEFIVIRPVNVIKEYVYFVIQTPIFIDEAVKRLTGTSGLRRVPRTYVEECIISIPPIDLQKQFAEKIKNIERQKELITKSIKETEDLFNSRMDYYFN